MEKLKPFGLPKAERLCSTKAIEDLFASGQSRYSYPIRVVYKLVEVRNDEPAAQIMFSVPRKRFKLAITRNLIRRRMREAYRLNKAFLLKGRQNQNIGFRLAFLYSANETCNYKTIEKSIISHLTELGQNAFSNAQ